MMAKLKHVLIPMSIAHPFLTRLLNIQCWTMQGDI